MIDSRRLARTLTERFGLPLATTREDHSDGQRFRIRPTELSPGAAFTVEIVVGWHVIKADFVPDGYARDLVRHLGQSDAESRAAFRTIARAAIDDNAEIDMRINGSTSDPLAPSQWPDDWSDFSLSVTKGNIPHDDDTRVIPDTLIMRWAVRAAGLVVALLPVEPVRDSAVEIEGEGEGQIREQLIRRRERKIVNREACIQIQGCLCTVCTFDFHKVFGEIGCGFIHVHHLEPLGLLLEPRAFDPATDLVPVCPNCHAMLHRRTPPYTPDELRTMMNTPTDDAESPDVDQ